MNLHPALYDEYDVVFFDELRFLQMHLVTDIHMQETRDTVMKILARIIRNTATLIGAQDRLHERDVMFIAKLRGIEDIYNVDEKPLDPTDLTEPNFKVAIPIILPLEFRFSDYKRRVIDVYKDKNMFLDNLLSYLCEHGSNKKVVVNVTRLQDGAIIWGLIQLNIGRKKLHRSMNPERVKLIYAANSTIAWQGDF